METSTLRKSMPVSALFDPKIVMPAIGSAFVKLDPRTLIKNPVMFVLEVVTALTTVILIRDLITGGGHILFEFQIILWLWFTVCSRTLPKRWRKAVARRRLIHCAANAPKPRPSSSLGRATHRNIG
jgi:high-affinity K+ transport system ATPase subunit B